MKRKAELLEGDRQKRIRVDDALLEDLFLTLPTEILDIIFEESNVDTLVLLSLTCKRFQVLFSSNIRWHRYYLQARKANPIKMEETRLHKGLKSDEDAYWCLEYIFLEYYDRALMRDCVEDQKGICAEGEYASVNFPILICFDEFPYHPKTTSIAPKDNMHTVYNPNIDYRKLAKAWWSKFVQFEFWRQTESFDTVMANDNCPCTNEEGELILYNGGDSEDHSTSDLDLKNDHSDRDLDLGFIDSESSYSGSESDIEEEYTDSNESSDEDVVTPILFSEAKREYLIKTLSERENFPLFVQILSAIMIGHCPAPGCDDSMAILRQKFLNKVVRTGDVLDEVINQLIRASTASKENCVPITICALQKLSIDDLLYLDEEVKLKFPYFHTTYHVNEIEESIPDIIWRYNLHWSAHFRADLPTADDYETMPDWLSLRHSVHKLFRKAGILTATSNATEHGVNVLSDFIRNILQAAVDIKTRNKTEEKNSLDLTSTDILSAIQYGPAGLRPQKIYSTVAYDDPAVIMTSDSEFESDYSSYEDSDNDSDDEGDDEEKSSEEIEYEYTELNKLLKERVSGVESDTSPLCIQSAVQYAQSDADNKLSDEYGGENQSEGDSDDSEEQINDINEDLDDDAWEEARGPNMTANQVTDHWVRTGLIEESVEYTGRFTDEAAQLFVSKYEEDLPMHEMSPEKRGKILELRRETNKLLKEEAEKELLEDLQRQTVRINQNNNDDLELDVTKQMMKINLRARSKWRYVLETALPIIRTSTTLKNVKIENFHFKRNKRDVLRELLAAIVESPSIDSLCVRTSVVEEKYSDILQKKSFTRLDIDFNTSTMFVVK